MALKEQLTADGATADEIAANPELTALNGQKATVMNGSFLRASLFTSVVAFGVAALVMGIGVVFGIIGFALRRLAPATDGSAQAVAPFEKKVLVNA